MTKRKVYRVDAKDLTPILCNTYFTFLCLNDRLIFFLDMKLPVI